ncbi:MAG: DinB family protein [Bacteroidales bacterium]
MNEFVSNNQEIIQLVNEWESTLLSLQPTVIEQRCNKQNRTIKQILGHLVDSASNNNHRIVHLQYGNNPLEFPNYATNGNNDRWIAIQNYQNESWVDLVQLWKYYNRHIVHVIGNINPNKLSNKWISAPNQTITLNDMVISYLNHLKLHLNEIQELINQ